MMFVFVDESEWHRPKTPGGYTVWAGAALHASNSKDFFRELFNLERKFWDVVEPYDFEIKGRLLLSRKALSSLSDNLGAVESPPFVLPRKDQGERGFPLVVSLSNHSGKLTDSLLAWPPFLMPGRIRPTPRGGGA